MSEEALRHYLDHLQQNPPERHTAENCPHPPSECPDLILCCTAECITRWRDELWPPEALS